MKRKQVTNVLHVQWSLCHAIFMQVQMMIVDYLKHCQHFQRWLIKFWFRFPGEFIEVAIFLFISSKYLLPERYNELLRYIIRRGSYSSHRKRPFKLGIGKPIPVFDLFIFSLLMSFKNCNFEKISYFVSSPQPTETDSYDMPCCSNCDIQQRGSKVWRNHYLVIVLITP